MPITLGNTYIEFTTLQESYTIPYVNVTSFNSKPIYAEDGYTLNRYEITVSGTALVSDGDPGYQRLLELIKVGVGQIFTVAVIVSTEGNESVLFEQTGIDSMNGPLMEISATEIAGRRSAILSFTITAYQTNHSGIPTNSILSHRWISSFSLDTSGRVTRTTTGTLVVDLQWRATLTNETPATSRIDISDRRPWADLFRKAILPLYTGSSGRWRRESQTFAYNEAGNSLIYTIVDRQARINLPDAALTGTCDMTYERTMAQMAWATMRFSCDLEGELNGSTRELLNAAVVLATSRIPLKDYKSIRIDRIMVNEQEMLDRVKLRFEITVLVPAIATDPSAGNYNTVPLANLIGKYFSVTRSCPWYPEPYGSTSSGIAAYPHWKDNFLSAKDYQSETEIPVADVLAAITEYCPPGTPTVTMIGGDESITNANTALSQGPFATMPVVTYNANVQPATVEKAQTVTNVCTDTRMHRMQTLYTQGSDFVFQAGKASVILEEVTTVKRTNTPPERAFRPIPSGFVVVKDDWKVNFGDVDPAGNRSFIGVYTRTLMSYDGGGATSNGYFTDSGRRQWWSPSNSVTAPVALGFDSGSNFQDATKTVLQSTTNQSYNVGTAQAYA